MQKLPNQIRSGLPSLRIALAETKLHFNEMHTI